MVTEIVVLVLQVVKKKEHRIESFFFNDMQFNNHQSRQKSNLFT